MAAFDSTRSSTSSTKTSKSRSSSNTTASSIFFQSIKLVFWISEIYVDRIVILYGLSKSYEFRANKYF